MKASRINLNNPEAPNCCRDGILFIFYPKKIVGNVMVRGFMSTEDLISYVKNVIEPRRYVKLWSYNLQDMIAYIGSDYRYTEAITFLKVDQNFLADIRKNSRNRLYYEAFRLGWIVDENNKPKPDEGFNHETNRP